ncbi:MAG TPA: cupin domain-containing protein [Streptosporangiaceae bacterium]|nr:cupin domain-containing protein [Streptosporangiaceae bacterium]
MPSSGDGADRARWHLGGLLTIRAAAQDTNGSLAVIEERAARGYTTPPHVHRREDETLFVIDGTLEYTVGGGAATVTAGEAAFLPRGVPHNFAVVSDQAHYLVIVTPGGFERFFSEVSPPAAAQRLPTPADHPHTDPVRMAASAARLGTTVFDASDRGALAAVRVALVSPSLHEITGAYRVIEDAVASAGPLADAVVDALALRLAEVAAARLSEHPVHARSLILLGILAERAGRDLPIGVPALVAAVRPDWPEATALAAAYLLAHFPSDAAAIESALRVTLLTEPDLGRLRRCLTEPGSVEQLGRVWPSPTMWTLDPAERDLDRRWRAALPVTAETVSELWRSETVALLAYLGAKAEHAVETALRDA